MSKICVTCGKAPAIGNNVSHSHRHTKRRFDPNLQRVRVLTAAGCGTHQRVCTSCLKAGKVKRAG